MPKRLKISRFSWMPAWLVAGALLGSAPGLIAQNNPLAKKFAEFPTCGLKQTPVLPTANENIDSDQFEGYAARTPGNETYGMPGWTRNFGHRFHKGVDILPSKWVTTGKKIELEYVDNKTRRSFTRTEPVKLPQDEVYAILDGTVVVENANANRSGYGKYVIIEHQWADGSRFLSMYCHLSRTDVDQGEEVKRGERIGMMGQTSSNPGGRRFLMAIPHMHFEIGRVIDESFALTKDAKRLSPPNLGGKYDPRNMQPFNPLEFLKKFHALTYSEFEEKRKGRADRDQKAEPAAPAKTEPEGAGKKI